MAANYTHRAVNTLFIVLALLPNPVGAVVCPPGVPHFRYVGDVANDARCTDNDIQSAINNTVCPGTFIVVSREHTYTAQHLSVSGKSFTMSATGDGIGCGNLPGATDSGSGNPPTVPLVTISGNGSQSVFDISGNSNVTFQYLEITGGGGDSGSHGGGINFHGSGSLTVDTSTIDLNHSGFGGGIEMNGIEDSVLTLAANAIIVSNTASGNGGGINIEGFAQLLAVHPFTLIGFNHAPNGKGGGIAAVSGARIDLGSPGFNALPVVNGNDAARGGGISLQNTGDGPVTAILFSTDPLHPVSLAGNFASQVGGAIYLQPNVDNDFTSVCAADFRLDGNIAPDGAAIFADADFPGIGDTPASYEVAFNKNFCPSSFVSQPCAAGVACNTVDDNVTADGANHPKPGAIISLSASFEGSVDGDRFEMRGNAAANAIRAVDAELHVTNCLIADNALSAETFRVSNGGNGDSAYAPQSSVQNCTIANNAHNSGSVIHTDYDFSLADAIVDQPVMSTLSTGGTPTITAHFVLAADPTGLAAAPDIFPGEPTFVNGSAGNYRLRAVIQAGFVSASAGIDNAPSATGDDHDLDGNPHDQDVPLVPNLFGVRDLGCYEAQPIPDRIFGDAFGDAISLVR